MIANYDATVLLLRAFISKAVGESNLVKPRLGHVHSVGN